jgi:hypothetical protein
VEGARPSVRRGQVIGKGGFISWCWYVTVGGAWGEKRGVGARTQGTGWNEGRLLVMTGNGEAALKGPASWTRGSPRRARRWTAEGRSPGLRCGQVRIGAVGMRAVGGTAPAKFPEGDFAFIWRHFSGLSVRRPSGTQLLRFRAGLSGHYVGRCATSHLMKRCRTSLKL